MQFLFIRLFLLVGASGSTERRINLMCTAEKKAYLPMAILLGGLAMLGPISIDIFLPAVPNMAEDLNVSIGSIELTLTAIF